MTMIRGTNFRRVCPQAAIYVPVYVKGYKTYLSPWLPPSGENRWLVGWLVGWVGSGENEWLMPAIGGARSTYLDSTYKTLGFFRRNEVTLPGVLGLSVPTSVGIVVQE